MLREHQRQLRPIQQETIARALKLGKRFGTPSILLTSVSRAVDQKVLLLREPGS